MADGFVGTPSTTLENTRRLIDAYRQAAGEAGRPAEIVLMRDAWVASTRAEAEAVYGPEVMAAYRYYWEHRLAEFKNVPRTRPSPWRAWPRTGSSSAIRRRACASSAAGRR